MPHSVAQGCHLETDSPQECVLDYRRPDMCLHADELTRREQCRWWRESEAHDTAAPQPVRARHTARSGR